MYGSHKCENSGGGKHSLTHTMTLTEWQTGEGKKIKMKKEKVQAFKL